MKKQKELTFRDNCEKEAMKQGISLQEYVLNQCRVFGDAFVDLLIEMVESLPLEINEIIDWGYAKYNKGDLECRCCSNY